VQAQQADLSDFHYDFQVAAKAPYREDGKNKTTPITAVFNIYKLPGEIRAKLEAEAAGVELKTGYDGDIDVLFKGIIVNTASTRVAPDDITTIYASDSWGNYLTSYFSKSFTLGTPVTTVLQAVAASFSLPVINRYARTETLPTGSVFAGKSKDIMNRLARDYEFSWSIKSEGVEIIDNLNPPLVDVSRVVELGKDLTHGPVYEDSLEDANKKKEKIIRRVTATALLNASLFPGVPVRFKNVQGLLKSFSDALTKPFAAIDEREIFIVDDVLHSGSNYEAENYSNITTKEQTL